MPVMVKNIFAAAKAPDGGEESLALFANSSARIERIVSNSHASPPGFWYDQEEVEWVILLRGAATLEFDNGELVELQAGDYLTIPRHVKHRVARTSGAAIWLAVHIK